MVIRRAWLRELNRAYREKEFTKRIYVSELEGTRKRGDLSIYESME